MNSNFLPISQAEIKKLGWNEVDFVCVTGDAYVDHPSFGIAIISRVLESMGYRVAMLSQPITNADFMRFGKPRLGFMVTSGNIDSMVNSYTVAKKKRSEDSYSAGNIAGKRPDRAVIVYSQKIRELYPDSFISIGGLEASLRRFAHYDYWDDKVRPSILLDSGADIISYGMGEHQTRLIAKALETGAKVSDMRDIRGICYTCKQFELPDDYVSCASYKKVSENMESYAKATRQQAEEHDHVYGKHITQKHDDDIYLVQTPPMPPLTTEELDEVFALPYQRMYHPIYEAQGGVKAIEEVEFSIMHNRGCFGNCNFCSIAYHQGRQITCRSQNSVIAEAESFISNPRFKGYIHDVGGPTANFRRPSCDKQLKHGLCRDKRCLGTNPCPALIVDHSDYLDLLRKLRAIKGVKKVFVRSGIRFDYMMKDKNEAFLKELVEHHVSGQLKVAPEHCSPAVLDKMSKAYIGVYERFAKRFYTLTKSMGKEQYLVPYLMSSHPGSTIRDALELAMFLKKNNMRPEQVQDFYPTPGTPSTAMFFTGLDPFTMEPVHIPKTDEEKRLQRALLQYYKPENRALIINNLVKSGKEYLIGTSPDCLVPPTREYMEQKRAAAEKSTQRGRLDTRHANKSTHKSASKTAVKNLKSSKPHKKGR